MATLYMYDAVNPDNIPADAQVVAGYVDGRYNDFQAMVAKFPNALHVPITVFGAPDVRVCDCETGDLTPDQAAAWAKSEVNAGRRPTIYCNISTQPAVVNSLAAQGLQFGRDVDWWAAHYTGTPHLEPGSVATQYADPGPYDISETDGVWPGVPNSPAPAPAPAPTPAPPQPAPSPVPPAHRNIFTPIADDGAFGPATIKAQQFVDFNGNVADCDGRFGPQSAKAMQVHLGVAADGFVGPVTIKALQRRVGAAQDGKWGPLTTKALQGALNAGKY